MIVDVVIPCFRVRRHVLDVVDATLAVTQVRRVIVVDDACPEHSGTAVEDRYRGDRRVAVLRHEQNQGVGGAMLSGYRHAFSEGADIVVKVDGDGQMDPRLIPLLINPIVHGLADYAKGNRFFYPRHLRGMPRVRLFGNALLSLVNKMCSGYWSIMDPTNGYTALHRVAYRELDLPNVDRGYFFESDMLYQLGLASACVVDVPMAALYGDEKSNLSVGKALRQFPGKYLSRAARRLALKYFVREFNIASVEMAFGAPALATGIVYGIQQWAFHSTLGETTPAGTVMIVGLLILVGFQLLLSAVNYDIAHEPKMPLLKRAPELLGAG